MDAQDNYEYHKLLKFLYFEGYADSYEEAEYLLEELNNEEFDALCADIFEIYEDSHEGQQTHINPQDRPKRTRKPSQREKMQRLTNLLLKIKQTKTQKEQVDFRDIVVEYLFVEGFADSYEEAEVIMVNMSEEWRESIIG
jgi:hypothetical protein